MFRRPALANAHYIPLLLVLETAQKASDGLHPILISLGTRKIFICGSELIM